MYSPEDVLIVSQARMTSTRLPGKVLMSVGGHPLLHYHLLRLNQTGIRIVLAITTNQEDDVLEEYCRQEEFLYCRGSEDDVLSRFIEVIKKYQCRIVVRVTSDCPLIDPQLISEGIRQYLDWNDEHIYLSNCFPRTYARGFDFEIFSAEALVKAAEKANESFDREHVTPYIWKNKDGDIIVKNIAQQSDRSKLRVCVDTLEDLALIRLLVEQYNAHEMNHLQIEQLLVEHPELAAINSEVEQKKT